MDLKLGWSLWYALSCCGSLSSGVWLFVQIVLIILCGRPFLRHLCVGSSNSHSVSWQADVDSVQSIVGRHQREKLKKKLESIALLHEIFNNIYEHKVVAIAARTMAIWRHRNLLLKLLLFRQSSPTNTVGLFPHRPIVSPAVTFGSSTHPEAVLNSSQTTKFYWQRV